MRIKLFGGLRQKAGFAEQEAAGMTVREALLDVCGDNEVLRAAIFDDAMLRPYVRVMVNGHDCELGKGLETTVGSSDEIAVFPPIAGGQ